VSKVLKQKEREQMKIEQFVDDYGTTPSEFENFEKFINKLNNIS